MKILFITKLLPYPVDAGGKLKTYNILKLLAKKHEIHFFSFVDSDSLKNNFTHLKSICKTVNTVPFPIINQHHKFRLVTKLILSVLNKKPFTVFKYYSSDFQRKIEKFLKSNSVDLLYIDHFAMAQYIPEEYSGRIIGDEHNISYLAFRTYANNEKNILLKFIYNLESKKLYQYEKRIVKKFNHIFTISQKDLVRLGVFGVNHDKISYLPIPIQTNYCYTHFSGPPTILFVGLLSWLPNEKGIHWFIKNCFPMIKSKIHNVNLKIIGKDGFSLYKYSDNTSITYYGFQRSLNNFYKQATVFIAPIQMGGGVRIKILESLGHGLPVVSTTIGADGIKINQKRDIILADTPDEFSKEVIRIINDEKAANQLSLNGYRSIKNNYSLHKAESALSKIIHA